MKYIVYKTTNQINNYIYVGVHKTANPKVFDGYLGCGVNIKIPYTYQHSKTKFQWDSARQCAKEVGGAVQNVLNGKYSKHKGKLYKYIDN